MHTQKLLASGELLIAGKALQLQGSVNLHSFVNGAQVHLHVFACF